MVRTRELADPVVPPAPAEPGLAADGGNSRAQAMDVRLKRAYEPAAAPDGYRVLVDRIWPRGVTREEAHLDEWAREIAPSTELRTWFGHDPARFAEFSRRYRDELAAPAHADALRDLRRRARLGTVTLVYGARDPQHNQAVVLAAVLRGGIRSK